MALKCCSLQPLSLVNIYARLVVDAVYTFNKDGTIDLSPLCPKLEAKSAPQRRLNFKRLYLCDTHG
jgi:hypothetical protein